MKIFVASFNRASDGAINLLTKKMKEKNILTHDYKKADFILAVGDRVETFDFVLKRFQENKRIIHLWAGEISNGTHDEIYRWAITNMSIAQFCTNEKAKQRVIHFCKSINKKPIVYIIGNIMLDNLPININKVPKQPFDLILYNPPTELSKDEILNEIGYIKSLLDKKYIWIEPNGDFGSELIKPYVTHKSLPRDEFLGLMSCCERFITNSSCMYYEAPFLIKKKQIIPIGKRNCDRESRYANMKIKNASDNVINILKTFKKIKKCTKCKKEYPATLDFFVVNNTKKDNLNPICKNCKAITDRLWGLNNKKKLKSYQKKYYKKNKKYIYQRNRKYLKTNYGLEVYKTSFKRYNNSKKRKIVLKKFRKTKKYKNYIKKYSKTETYKKNRRKIKAKRKKLGYIELFNNHLPKEIKTIWHHINDLFVVPFPKKLHQINSNPNKKIHRKNCNVWIKTLYGLDLNKLLNKSTYYGG